MSIDEYAEYEKGNGTPVFKVGDVWWRAVRPFFYRPLLPFQEIERSNSNVFPSHSFGYQHAVLDVALANSYLNLFVFDDIQNYSFDKLKSDRKNNIRRAGKRLTVCTIDEPAYFVDNAYDVYRIFYKRTHYGWKNERLNQRQFEEWTINLFMNKKAVVHGIYNVDKLEAINISYLVEDILIDAAFFSTDIGLKLRSSDLVRHVIREAAANMKDVRYILEGPLSGQRGLDNSKQERGCKLLAVPAYLSMNSIFLRSIKLMSRPAFEKLTGYDENSIVPWIGKSPDKYHHAL